MVNFLPQLVCLLWEEMIFLILMCETPVFHSVQKGVSIFGY